MRILHNCFEHCFNSHTENPVNFYDERIEIEMFTLWRELYSFLFRQMAYRSLQYRQEEQFYAFFMEQKRLLLTTKNEIRLVAIEEISAIKVDDYLCTFYFIDKRTFSCTKSMKEIELQLPMFFCRVTRNLIINLFYIESLDIVKNYVTLRNGEKIQCSVRGVAKIKKELVRINEN